MLLPIGRKSVNVLMEHRGGYYIYLCSRCWCISDFSVFVAQIRLSQWDIYRLYLQCYNTILVQFDPGELNLHTDRSISLKCNRQRVSVAYIYPHDMNGFPR